MAPENTLAALRCSLARGYRAVEFDVMLSRDGVPVLMHDPDFGRTIAGSGKVAESTAAQLALLDAGAWYGQQFSGEPVPTLGQVADYCMANEIWMNIEVKPAPGFAVETGRVVGKFMADYLAAYAGPLTMPLFSSFSVESLMAAKDAAPEIPRGFLTPRVNRDWREQMASLDAVALHTNEKYLSPDQVRAIKQAGIGLFCYTVNDPARARQIFDWGVDAFCTDRIDLIGADFV